MSSGDWRDQVLDFWFGLDDQSWFRGGDALDADCRDRFLGLWTAQRYQPAVSFTGDATTALAAVILFDQFPRNMFRDAAEQFSTDGLALAIARDAIAKGYDDDVEPRRRSFFYLPFEHSERLEDQERAVRLFEAFGDPKMLDFAKRHRDIVARFGRFPHRNAILGRAPTPDEAAAGEVVPW